MRSSAVVERFSDSSGLLGARPLGSGVSRWVGQSLVSGEGFLGVGHEGRAADHVAEFGFGEPGVPAVHTNRYSVPVRLIGKRVRVVLHASQLVVYDQNVEVARHERLIAKGSCRLELDHYLEALIRKPGAFPGATALEQARSAGKFTPVHDAWWAPGPQGPRRTGRHPGPDRGAAAGPAHAPRARRRRARRRPAGRGADRGRGRSGGPQGRPGRGRARPSPAEPARDRRRRP